MQCSKSAGFFLVAIPFIAMMVKFLAYLEVGDISFLGEVPDVRYWRAKARSWGEEMKVPFLYDGDDVYTSTSKSEEWGERPDRYDLAIGDDERSRIEEGGSTPETKTTESPVHIPAPGTTT